MSVVTTHVLDTALGRPAAGVPVRLERVPDRSTGEQPQVLADAVTDADGRTRELGPNLVEPGTFRLVFDTAAYFAASEQSSFFPEVSISFTLADPCQHYHVPVLLSPFAYSTYRGS
jgi:5-hydroxyisourate hydrolase